LKGGDWAEVKRLVLAAEAAGFDALIPIARWKGYGGATDWNDLSFETFTWAAGLAAITERIQVFATVQVPTVHPVRAAKEVVTVDHISGGRFGLNVVAGWNESEIRMFGQSPRSKEERYEAADEFVTLLKRLWTEEEFDFEGRFFQAKAAHSAPHPLQKPGPLIMSAGGSESGSNFAAKQADIQFLNLQTLDGAQALVAGLRRQAEEKYGREIKVMTCLYIICRETEQEARDYFHHVVREKGDMAAAQNMLDALLPTSSFKALPEVLEQICAGFGGVALIGTPAQVVDGFKQLAAIGLDGAAVSWIDYDEGIRQYRDVLLPMLRAAGLRG
jgi:alkanesulfonate monooxygenase SsuD/methylene tetrahydromethanopterin reductase-like flavin-dependent oxidoreductase (luciferase family)